MRRFCGGLAPVLLLSFLFACGGKRTDDTKPSDAGTVETPPADGGLDAGVDAGIDEQFAITCSDGNSAVPTKGARASLTATVSPADALTVAFRVSQDGGELGSSTTTPTEGQAGDAVVLNGVRTTGPATGECTATWHRSSGDVVRSATVPLTIDAEPPQILQLQTDRPYYGGSALVALVSAQLADPGSGVDDATPSLSINGLQFSGTPGSNGTWSFTVPVDALGAPPAFSGTMPFTVTAADLAEGPNVSTVDGGLWIDFAPPTVVQLITTPNPAPGSNGYYPQVPGSTLPIDVIAADDGGTGVASMKLSVADLGFEQLITIDGGTSTAAQFHYDVLIPSLSTPFEGELSMSLEVTDRAGNTFSPSAQPTGLLLDGRGPIVNGTPSVSSPDAVVSGVPWFSQMGPDIVVDAQVIDLGSGVDAASLRLLDASSRRVDNGATVASGVPNHYRFNVPRIQSFVPPGQQALLSLHIAGADRLGNPVVAPGGAFSLGLDGRAPDLTFDLTNQYPPTSSGCGTSTPPGVSSTIECGHDGAHFLRRSDDGSTLSFTASDPGGSAIAQATCTIPGSSCTVSGSNGTYTFVFNPSTATFASDATGEGSVPVTVSVVDRVGNASSLVRNIAVTRFRWMRTLPPSTGPVNGAPIVTPALGGTRYLVVAGAGTSNQLAQLSVSGAFIAASTVMSPVTAAPAFSPSTGQLYLANGSRVSVFTVTTNGMSGLFECDLGSSSTIRGSPVILGGNPERVLVSDASNRRLSALTGTGAAGCSAVNPSVLLSTATQLYAPAASGSDIYVPFMGSGQSWGMARVDWSGSGFGTPLLTDFGGSLGTGVPTPSVAITSNAVYFSDQSGGVRRAARDLSALTWTAAISGTLMNAPLVPGALLYASTQSSPGGIYGLSTADGALAFSSQPAAGAPALSAIALGGENNPVIYFADSTALHAAIASGTAVSMAPAWGAPFAGTSSHPMASLSAPPTIDSDGTLFFVTTTSRVFAIETDSPGGASSAAGGWPRANFDHCNQGNASLMNCP